MAISYNNLWKLLIDREMNKGMLCSMTGMSSSTMAKMTNQEMVSLEVLERICAVLDCNIENIMEFTKLEDVKKKLNIEKCNLER